MGSERYMNGVYVVDVVSHVRHRNLDVSWPCNQLTTTELF